MVKEYKEMTEQCFAQVTEEEQLKVFGLFGDEDPIVHTFDLFSEHYTQAIHFHGEHRLIEKAIFHYLMPVIDGLTTDKKGANGALFLSVRIPLPMGYGKPKSSLHKLMSSYSITITSIL